MNCETDFVSRNTIFQDLTSSIANLALQTNPKSNGRFIVLDTDSVSGATLTNSGKTVGQSITESIGQLGEKMEFRRGIVSGSLQPSGSNEVRLTCGHVHGGGSELNKRGLGRIGCLVCLTARHSASLTSDEAREKVRILGKRLAQHIVGFAPVSLSEAEAVRKLDSNTAELETGESQQDYIDRTTLSRQSYLLGGPLDKAQDQSVFRVSDAVRNYVEEHNGLEDIAIKDFVRFECGEGIERQVNDFAQEVQKQAGL
jgi:elongation factor Ts